MQKVKNKLIAGILVVVCSICVVSGVDATEEMEKKQFETEVIKNSTAIAELDLKERQMQRNLNQLEDTARMLEDMQDTIDRYNELSAKYDKMKEDSEYYDYQDASRTIMDLASIPPQNMSDEQKAKLAQAIQDQKILEVKLSNEYGKQFLSFKEYMEYSITKDILDKRFGIEEEVVSLGIEYENFRQLEIEAIPMLSDGIKAISRSRAVVENSLIFGANKLYDTALMLQDNLDLLKKLEETTKNTYDEISAKYDKGLKSKYDLMNAQLGYKAALYNYNSLKRQLDNVHMQMNVMRGKEPMVPIRLNQTEDIENLFTKNESIELALKNNAQIKNLEDTLKTSKSKLKEMKLYYFEDSEEYKKAEQEVEKNELALKKEKLVVETKAINDFNQVILKKQNYISAKQDLNVEIESYENSETYVELGYLTNAQLEQISTKLTIKTNAFSNALRGYAEAIETLENTIQEGISTGRE